MKTKSYYKRPMFFGWYSINYDQGTNQTETAEQKKTRV